MGRKIAKKGSAKKKAGGVDKRVAGLERVAERFVGLRPAAEVLRTVVAVPTCLVQLDHATEVGGWPTERFGLVHGPSAGGKTRFVLALLKSFILLGHWGLLIDAEQTTPIEFCEEIMGAEARSPRFFAARPATFEQTRKLVRDFCTQVAAARRDGELAEDTTALIVVDSIRKLVPEGILAKLVATAKTNGIDGVGGRAAQLKAAMNAAWMDELVPLLADTRTAMVAIARETEDPDADPWAKKAGRDFKTGGGKALFYDASIVARIEMERHVAEKVTEEEYKGGKRAAVFGERHRVTIRKTKVASQEDRQTVCWFHTSNGALSPAGLDPARDLVDLGLRLGVVQRHGSWLKWGTCRWQGEHAAVKRLAGDPAMLAQLGAAVRAEFAASQPPAHDADGVVLE